MKEIKVLKAYKDHKEFIIHANNIINNVNDTEQTNGLKEILIVLLVVMSI